MKKSTCDVLIAGAGPGGSTQRHDIGRRIVERVESDKLCADVGGGYHIGSSTLAMLDPLDVGGQCREAGVHFPRIESYTERGSVIRKLPLPQIGADGLHSKVRESVFGDGPPRCSGLTCCWRRVGPAEYDTERFSPQVAVTQLGPGTTLAATSVGGEVIWSATWRTASFERSANAVECKRRLAERFGEWASPARQSMAATAPEVIAEVGIWDREPCPLWHHRRVALIGDVAYPMTPLLGQGANSAMLDALCWRIV